jgi:hypothetical protein
MMWHVTGRLVVHVLPAVVEWWQLVLWNGLMWIGLAQAVSSALAWRRAQ